MEVLRSHIRSKISTIFSIIPSLHFPFHRHVDTLGLCTHAAVNSHQASNWSQPSQIEDQYQYVDVRIRTRAKLGFLLDTGIGGLRQRFVSLMTVGSMSEQLEDIGRRRLHPQDLLGLHFSFFNGKISEDERQEEICTVFLQHAICDGHARARDLGAVPGMRNGIYLSELPLVLVAGNKVRPTLTLHLLEVD